MQDRAGRIKRLKNWTVTAHLYAVHVRVPGLFLYFNAYHWYQYTYIRIHHGRLCMIQIKGSGISVRAFLRLDYKLRPCVTCICTSSARTAPTENILKKTHIYMYRISSEKFNNLLIKVFFDRPRYSFNI